MNKTQLADLLLADVESNQDLHTVTNDFSSASEFTIAHNQEIIVYSPNHREGFIRTAREAIIEIITSRIGALEYDGDEARLTDTYTLIREDIPYERRIIRVRNNITTSVETISNTVIPPINPYA